MELPSYEECLVCFVHVYNKKLPLAGRVRDHDNIEEKHVLDIISSFYLKSDSGLFVDTFHMTRLGTEDGTFLFVMEQADFQVGSVKTASLGYRKRSTLRAG